jgi:hypothetical protein
LETRWHFVEIDKHWEWRKIGPTGAITGSSAPSKDYGAIVTDAIRNGFQPAAHHWHVITEAGITRFEPGTAPTISPNQRRGMDGTDSGIKRRATDK